MTWGKRQLLLGDDSTLEGTIYLIHFDKSYSGRSHYLGWVETRYLARRLAKHLDGTGSEILASLKKAGIGWKVVQTWDNKTQIDERRMKACNNTKRICPICQQAEQRLSPAE